MTSACVNHTVYVYDRGGLTRIAEITDLTSVSWERVGDDISFCDLVVNNPGAGCARVLEQMEPARHELVVYRGQNRVWEGPLTLMRYRRETVEIQARDVMHYAYRIAQTRPYDNRYPNVATVVDRAYTQLVTELTRRESESPPINVVPFITRVDQVGDARTTRNTITYQKTVFDDVDDMAANSGLDYTVVGRSIILHDTSTALGRLPTLTENDVLGEIIVTVYGMEMATFAAVSGADGAYGIAGVGDDPYYGRWEIIDDAYDEEEGSDAPTQSELNEQAQRNVAARIPVPVEVRVPDGSQLSGVSPIKVEDLVPGVQVPVRATLTARTFSQVQKLRKMKVTEDSNGERVQITLAPTASVLVEEGA